MSTMITIMMITPKALESQRVSGGKRASGGCQLRARAGQRMPREALTASRLEAP